MEKIIGTLPSEPLSPDLLRLILAEFALQLLFGAQNSGQAAGSLLLAYGQGKYFLGPYEPLLDDLIGDQPGWKKRLSPCFPP